MKKNQIESVRIEKVVDEIADTSTLGEYTNENSDWAICRHCGEYVYNAEEGDRRKEEIEEEIYNLDEKEESPEIEEQIKSLQKELDTLSLHDCPHSNREFNFFLPYAGGEEPGTDTYQEFGLQDFKRMEGLSKGDWSYIGIIAKAVIRTTNGTMQTIRSGGLWGIESDSGDYLQEVAKDELENLRAELIALGFGKRAIDYAFQNVKDEDED